MNYEGPADRVWAMWEDSKFDPTLIAQDLALAVAGGYNAIRIFVQPALRDDILVGQFCKLDKVVEIPAQNNLQILSTLSDYGELDLSNLATVDTLIAARYAASPTIPGYDLKNEPQFVDLAGAKYPSGKAPLIQTDKLISIYGEQIS